MSVDTVTQGLIYKAALQLFAEKGGTDISISELAQRAGLARGTIYNNLPSLNSLFEEVATQLTREMTEIVLKSLGEIKDPVTRLSLGVSLFLKRSHEDPDWGRFLIRFGLSNTSLKELWDGPVAEDIKNGIAMGRFKADPSQVTTLVTLIGCSTIGCMHLIREGVQTWKEASESIIEFILKALGVSGAEAQKSARNAIGKGKASNASRKRKPNIQR